ncbi:MAG: bacillithiol biosynthesis protein BshC, partial [Gemmatimonadota bacterium]
ALLHRIERAPEEFTPAAALRPALESRLLPVAATVLGPGELAYWAQLPPLFAALDVAMPAVMPRDAWVLVEPRVDRLIEKLELDVATVEREGKGIDDRWIARSRPPGVRDGLAALERELTEGFRRLSSAIDAELPGLKAAAGKAAHRVRQALAELGGTVDARVRERESIALAQAARIRAHLTPGGRPQERTVAAAQFLARHGRALVNDLFEAGRVAGPEEQD